MADFVAPSDTIGSLGDYDSETTDHDSYNNSVPRPRLAGYPSSMGVEKDIDGNELLALWEKINGQQLPPTWRTEFLAHPALPEIKAYKRWRIVVAMKKYPKLDHVVEHLRSTRLKEDPVGRPTKNPPKPKAEKLRTPTKAEKQSRDNHLLAHSGQKTVPYSDKRPQTRAGVVHILRSVRSSDVEREGLHLIDDWLDDPALNGIVKYRENLIREIAAKHHAAQPRDLPALIAKDLRAEAQAVARDRSLLLYGRQETRLSGGNQGPVDRSIHKKIGPTQKGS